MPRAVVSNKKEGHNRVALLGLLQRLQPGLASKDVIEQATNYVFRDGLAWTYNDEVAVSHPLPEGFPSIEGAVPAEPLLKLLSKSTAEMVLVTAGQDELRIRCGKSEAGVALTEAKLPVDNIPMPGDKDWSDLPDGWCAAAAMVRRSASEDASSPVLTCVLWGGRELIGCDNFQITIVSLGKKAKDLDHDILIPADAIRHIVAFAPVAWAEVKGWMHFIDTSDVVLSCRTVEGKYPDITDHLEVEGTEIAFPDQLPAALDRAGVFAVCEFEQDRQVEIEADGDGLLVVSGKGAGGWFREDLPLTGKVQPFKFAVNPDVLVAALKLSHKVLVGPRALKLQGDNFIHVVALE